MTTSQFLEIATIILIALGAGVMLYAIIKIGQIISLKQERAIIRNWQVLFALTILFFLGYLTSITLVLIGRANYLIIAAGVIFFFGALFVLLVSRISYSTIQHLFAATNVIQAEQAQLGQQSSEKDRLIRQLHTAADISRSISGTLVTHKLLQEAVDLILNRFELYYVGIFFADASERYAVLEAGTGDAGKAMIADRHKLPIAESSMVGWTIIHRQARIALDVGQEAVRFANPHLPNTRSEMALPLISKDRAIGALSVQSEKPEAFNQEDIIVLQNIADTLATAVENARLFEETQHNLEELRASQRAYVTKSWSGTAKEHQGYDYSAMADELAPGAEVSSIDVPLVLREQVIGQLHLEGQQDWTPEERSLVEAVATQAALAMENARLLDESRQMALRERIAAEITGKVWASPNTDFILQTAIKELGRALRADEATIELKVD
jgi:GAF domain-containing protein